MSEVKALRILLQRLREGTATDEELSLVHELVGWAYCSGYLDKAHKAMEELETLPK